jgi:uncharacterized membrane protein YphA (DoxX/SURF4 family)
MCCEGALLSAAERAVAADAVRLFLGSVWLYAAVSKARAPGVASDAVRRLLPSRIAAVAPRVVPLLIAAELLLGLCLILGWHDHVAAGISALAFVLFTAAIGAADLREDLSESGCGCFGTPLPVAATLDETAARAIARNIILVAFAFVVATQP